MNAAPFLIRWRQFGAVLVLWSLAGLAPARAAQGESGFTKGNRLYAAGQFAEAARAYESDVRQGEVTANLFYNLANAEYRLGERGRAILNYQRTLILEPAHAEASANLAFIRGRANPETGHAPGMAASLRDTLAGPGVDLYCGLAAVAGWVALLACCAVAFGRIRVAGVVLAAIAGLGCVLCAGVAWWLDGGLKSSQRAVVLADNSSVLYAPADNAKAILRLPAGGEVRLLSEQGAWVYVQLGDGARGWMPSDKVERVIPVTASRPSGG